MNNSAALCLILLVSDGTSIPWNLETKNRASSFDQPNSDGLQHKDDGLQPKNDGLQPNSDGLLIQYIVLNNGTHLSQLSLMWIVDPLQK